MQISVAKRLQKTEEYYFSKKLREIDELRKSGKDIINLAIGSPDLPPHPDVIKCLSETAELPNVHGYPGYKGSPVLRNAISDWYKKFYHVSVDADNEVLPLIGSKEGIFHICMTYLNEGDQVLIPNPGYPTYTSAVELTGAEAISYELSSENDWLPDLRKIESQDLSKVKMMWINYPHMPTGGRATLKFFEEIVEFAIRNNILLCHDNPYSFILNPEPLSVFQAKNAKDVAIELNSLSKSSNMAGWRIGMLIASETRIKEILRFKSNLDSGMFLPLQLAAAKALTLDQEWYDHLNGIYEQRRLKVFEIMDLLSCKYDRNQVGMFVWAKVPDNYKDSYELCDSILYRADTFITPGGIFGTAGARYIRISLCADEKVFIRAIERIKKVIES